MLFKNLKHFDTQNPVIGNLVREVDMGKKQDLSKFLSQAPDVKDLELRSRLNNLRSRNEFFNGGDDNNNKNYTFIPPPPPPQLPQPSCVPPPPLFQLPNLSDLFSNNRPPLLLLKLHILSFLNDEQASIFHGHKYKANNVRGQANW